MVWSIFCSFIQQAFTSGLNIVTLIQCLKITKQPAFIELFLYYSTLLKYTPLLLQVGKPC